MEESQLESTSDFSRVAASYDATREVPKAKLSTCYERLVQHGLMPARGTVLDAGCGTGQVSLVLAEMGYEVRGFDISPDMVAVAEAKCQSGWRARYAVADVRCLPELDQAFDVIVVSKLFQHVRDWKDACLELLRVLRLGGSLIELNDRGAFGNSVRKHFAGRADVLGYTQRYVGLDPHDRHPLSEFLTAQGCRRAAFDATNLRWEKLISYGGALDQLQKRLFAEFWYLPDDAYERLLVQTACWVDEQPQGRDTVEVMAPYLSVEVFQKSTA